MPIPTPRLAALGRPQPPAAPSAPASEAPAEPGAARDPRLSNKDLVPLEDQHWGAYNIFAFWMSDVHSVGGYVTAGSLFALGLASWQVLVALLAGILIVQFFCNLVAKPSQATGVPFPVINRSIFGVRGANIPAVIRGLIAIAWYGVQTYLASQSLVIVMLKFWPQLAPLAVNGHGFLGLSVLGYGAYAVLWLAQGLVFWHGMEAIKRFVDWAGPAVYVVMLLLAVYLVSKAGWNSISLNLSAGRPLGFGASIPVMLSAIALVVSYFSGPMLNFGDFSRYAKSFRSVKRGNLLGLPVNFLFFSLLTVITSSATVPVFGKLITDPIETVSRIDAPFAVILGGLTFVIATVGINIVANFISPAFDFSHVAPQKISWRMGGMIAAVGSVVLTPWNWYSNATAIQYSLGILGALIGPLFGILIAGYYIVSRQRVWVEEMYTMSPAGRYWFVKGFNPNAVWATALAGLPAIASVILPTLLGQAQWISDYSWFLGCGLGFAAFAALERARPQIKAGTDPDPQPAPAP